MPKPTAQRVAAHRTRKREAGLVEFRAWVTKEQREDLREIVSKMKKAGD